jgi:hypothetical protein
MFSWLFKARQVRHVKMDRRAMRPRSRRAIADAVRSTFEGLEDRRMSALRLR